MVLGAVIEDRFVLPIVEKDIQAVPSPLGGRGSTTLLGHGDKKDKSGEGEGTE